MITKDTIFNQLHLTSNKIAKKFDILYSQEISNIAEEMAISYQILFDIINKEDQLIISDNDFQSALLFWTALNTYLSGIELVRLGYSKEPPMIMRNVLEIFASAYDIHVHPEKLDILRNNPKKFFSTKSITIVKNIHPVIGRMYGSLSDQFTHVSILHSVPHYSKNPFCVGGLLDQNEQKVIICNLFPVLMLTLDVLSSVLEIAFINEVSKPCFWKKNLNGLYEYSPPKEVIDRGQRLIKKMQDMLKK
ncbi:MAG: hypothetical protein ABIJ23_03705 [Candidatus Magasanikbacteria bacterium]|nr:hypothetical protein [Patescibacteria group bacterium]MBU2416283.1 hypothetical protein [Patescibacteria group bacterium]